MTKNTRRPALLKELWNALGNDPYQIAECLVRPILADQLIHHWYAYDKRFHEAVQYQAKTDLLNYSAAENKKLLSGFYSEIALMNDNEVNERFPGQGSKVNVIKLQPPEWKEMLLKLSQTFNPNAVASFQLWKDSLFHVTSEYASS